MSPQRGCSTPLGFRTPIECDDLGHLARRARFKFARELSDDGPLADLGSPGERLRQC